MKDFNKRLEKHPKLKARFESILLITEGEEGGSDTADYVEEKTVTEVRKLGQEVMEEWAEKKSINSTDQYKDNHPQARSHKKKESLGIPPLAL